MFIFNQLGEEQHGFTPGRSVESNLSVLLNSVACDINAKAQTDVIYADFIKAFDSVNHRFLLHKLKLFGFSGNLLQWFQSYLTCRLQRVVSNGVHSEWSNVSSGVPQGSILGPILFLISINDLPSVLKYSNYLLYADDAKFYKTVYDLHVCLKLQLDLNSIALWCQSWKLSLNMSKCCITSFTLNNLQISFDYTLNCTKFLRVTIIKDLGIFLTSNLNFNVHTDFVNKKARKVFGYVVRNCKSFHNTLVLKLLYFSFVRPYLEFATVAWYLFNLANINKIERVQMRFVRYLCRPGTSLITV